MWDFFSGEQPTMNTTERQFSMNTTERQSFNSDSTLSSDSTSTNYEWKWSRVASVPYESIITYFLVVDYILIVPIIVGNALILTSIVKFRRLRSRMHILIGNLAVSDLLLGLIFIPYDILFLTNIELSAERYFCLARWCLLHVFLGASILNLFAISLERYMAIVHPLFPWKYNRTILIGIIFTSWTISMVTGLLPLLGWNKWEPGIPCDMELILTKPYKSLVLIIMFGSLVANFVMYIKVVRTAVKHMKAIESHPAEKTVSNVRLAMERPTRKNYKKTKLMMLLLGVFAICWGPYMILVIADIFFLEDSTELITARKILSEIGVLNSGLNWIIFGLKNSTFRKAFKEILTCGLAPSDGSLAVSTTA